MRAGTRCRRADRRDSRAPGRSRRRSPNWRCARCANIGSCRWSRRGLPPTSRRPRCRPGTCRSCRPCGRSSSGARCDIRPRRGSGCPRIGAEPRLVDPGLRMLDPHADREGLGLDMHAGRVEHRRTCRARCGRSPARHGRPRDSRRCAGASPRTRRAPSASVAMSSPSTRVLEAIFAAQPLDRLAHALDHRHQPEGADMRMRLGQDFLGRAGLHELGQHLAVEMARVLDPAVELAVGKGAGAAFAELDVAIRG